ncbi:hypothetical protein OG194_29760 [Streptomyces sp. NBC_01288]|uniref:hypothetical protein n=1 Tax=Streptomyces sp. NBC_01288 TaxID=2903814 RepID=UPI002E0F5043|nr:hypothetical protein OG194_29760 [Streptomyces sp. NBC_01288]
MTPHQRTALGCRIASVALAVSTYWMATEQEWLLSFGLLSGSASLALVGGRCQALHFAERARHQRARRAATGSAELPVPCCSFWRHSDGAVHGPDCTRPQAARRDGYRLDSRSRAAFDEITARYDDRSSA